MSRRITTESDYLVAGRSLGPVLMTFTVFATWFGAETCIAAAGAVYEQGLSGGSADPFGYAACIIVTGLVFAVPLWRLKLTTLADLFRLRFDASVERTAVLLMVPTSLFWAAAQVRAFGQVLSSASGLEIEITVGIAAAVVITYTIAGGLLADAWTDVVQGIVLIAGLGMLLWAVVAREGLDVLGAFGASGPGPLGVGAALEGGAAATVGGGAAAVAAGTQDVFRVGATGGAAEELTSFLSIVEEWSVPIIGSLVAAEVVTRMIAARSAAVARNATVVAGFSYLLIGLVPVALGMMGAGLLPGLEEPEQILPLLAAEYLPTALYIIFAGALVSAILSTVDSALLAAGGLVSHNIVVQLRPGLGDAAKVRVARVAVACFGAVAYVMALRAERVYALVEEASSFGSAGIVTVVVFGLFTRIGGRGSALAALLIGVIVWVVGAYVLWLPYPYLTSLAAAVGGYVLAATAGSRSARILEPAA